MVGLGCQLHDIWGFLFAKNACADVFPWFVLLSLSVTLWFCFSVGKASSAQYAEIQQTKLDGGHIADVVGHALPQCGLPLFMS